MALTPSRSRDSLPAFTWPILGLVSTVLIISFFALVLPWSRAEDEDHVLLGKSYPLRVSVSYHAALFHWVDSLSGMSGGKTVPAYHEEFISRFGRITRTQRNLLERFREARARDSRRQVDVPSGARGLGALRHTFLEAENLDSALAKARSEMDEKDFAVLRETLLYFRPKYEILWDDGAIPRRFLRRLEQDDRKKKLERLLARIAHGFDVKLSSLPRPTVVLVPVPSGYGTHATAVGPYLLVEVRPPDRLAEQASVIVHENSHYLFFNMNRERRERFDALVSSAPAPARKAWRALHEALPTALGQGVADQTFRPQGWSPENTWYHTREVDAYAKALYPLVRDVLDRKGQFDESFLKEALARYPSESFR